jgi:hypothetical protein
MTRVLHIFLESYNRHDLCGTSLYEMGFAEMPMDGRPVTTSDAALFASETGVPYEKRPWITNPQKLLSSHIKTRIFARPFPSWCHAEALDPEAVHTQREEFHVGSPLDPHSRIFNELRWFVTEYWPRDVRHVMYWTTLGHADWRLGAENKGVPAKIPKTLVAMTEIIRGLIREINMDETTVLIHPDHGTKRSVLSFEQAMFDSFIWVYPRARWKPLGRDVTWDDVRATLCSELGVKPEVIATKGESFLCSK